MSKGREECPKEENLVIRLLFDWIPQLESGPYTGDSDFTQSANTNADLSWRVPQSRVQK